MNVRTAAVFTAGVAVVFAAGGRRVSPGRAAAGGTRRGSARRGTQASARGPSALPGGSRGHVLAPSGRVPGPGPAGAVRGALRDGRRLPTSTDVYDGGRPARHAAPARRPPRPGRHRRPGATDVRAGEPVAVRGPLGALTTWFAGGLRRVRWRPYRRRRRSWALALSRGRAARARSRRPARVR
ncbi:hypothetical protein NKH77_10285 [Streptomyces sp. M19]